MRTEQWLPLLGLLCCLGWSGCGDLKTDLPAAGPQTGLHEPGWSDTASTRFHGKVLKADGYATSACVPCHAGALNGGTSGVSCYSCHASFPHMTGWTDPASAMFHGEYLQASGWQVGTCASCHGATFTGGTSGVGCYGCHASYPHGTGWTTTADTGFHGRFIRSAGWDMTSCTECHGPTYAGGRTNVSCRTCHNLPAGPENCVTCHGGANSAPPRDLADNTATTVRGVGAHQRHLVGGGRYSNVIFTCTGCHAVPATMYAAGHVDSDLPAEVFLAFPLASADPTGVPGPPAFRADSLRCTNAFCHGNFSLPRSGSSYAFAYTDSVMSGWNYAPLWTGGAAEAACGTCHGLPPAGHSPSAVTACGSCHTGVMNTGGQIADRSKHINGKINVFGQERPFFCAPGISTSVLFGVRACQPVRLTGPAVSCRFPDLRIRRPVSRNPAKAARPLREKICQLCRPPPASYLALASFVTVKNAMHPSHDPTDAQRLADLTLRLLEQCQEKQERLAAGLGLTLAEFRLLRTFRHVPSLHAGLLAERLGVSPGRLTRITDGLVRKHLVRRAPAPEDRRVIQISLTPRGARLQRHLLHDFTATHEDILRHLPRGGAAAVLMALEKLNDALREWAED